MLTRRSLLAVAAASLLPLPAFADMMTSAYEPAAFAAAQASGKPILIHIHASWCPTCKAQNAVLKDLMTDAAYKDVVIIKVDFDAQKDVVEAMGANSQSTLIMFKGKTEVGRSVGATNKDVIGAMMKLAV